MTNVCITVLRTSDAAKGQVTLPLTASLDTLKDSISSQCPNLGPVKKRHMRLFHLGRELKSSGRSLSNLGIGKFDNYLIHLKSSAPSTGSGKATETVELDLSDDDDDGDDVEVQEDGDGEEEENEIVELDDSQDSNNAEVAGRKRSASGASGAASSGGSGNEGGEEVIDLLDDSDDDDDDDDIAVVETPVTAGGEATGSKRRRT